ncbi:FAD:protein FMN transferase [Fulvivirga sediminis]|uniref:FAD:protein FMN transferase n=1 Tax=Fulvivirga sediminis TaxID=2803949 RepID=A0A937JWP6_9BACT|nr:FAD:protein FMN transferase [Fulvivirga sediminis]MBL3654743.1 FAD:protein FMN transferase [Fulvivirga sediminis]
MTLRYKNIIYTLVLLLAVFLVWKYRKSNQIPLGYLTGKTMGPIEYHIKYFDDDTRYFQKEVDSLLQVFNQSLSTYIPESEISRFNRDSVFVFESPFFYPVLEDSRKIFEYTDGAFDPTIMPVVNAWGFGPQKEITVDSAYIDSLMTFVGMEKVLYNEKQVWKSDNRVQLDFSALAKGYGIDVVGHFLEDKGIENLFVEIGGEVCAKGKNLQKDKYWEVGILDPRSDQLNQYYYAYAKIKDRAMATSGNYFNYQVIDGVMYGHTLSPKTGHPIKHSLLSATVFAPDCMTADALATACMVMGKEKSMVFFKEHTEFDALLVYTDANGELHHFITEGIREDIEIAK